MSQLEHRILILRRYRIVGFAKRQIAHDHTHYKNYLPSQLHSLKLLIEFVSGKFTENRFGQLVCFICNIANGYKTGICYIYWILFKQNSTVEDVCFLKVPSKL